LRKLKQQLPQGRSLAGVRITAEGDRLVVRDGSTAWNPDSGQGVFDFELRDLAEKVAPFAAKAATAAARDGNDLTAEDWYDWACDLEATSPAHAKEAYARALELNSKFADAHVNLGRLLHEDEKLKEAVEHYQAALTTDPKHTVAAFNLGIALEDLGRDDEAIEAYENAIRLDPSNADAHYNVARLYESLHRPVPALKHLKAYRLLVRS
jgi:tetratricopeptide (TPR) repeat protein